VEEVIAWKGGRCDGGGGCGCAEDGGKAHEDGEYDEDDDDDDDDEDDNGKEGTAEMEMDDDVLAVPSGFSMLVELEEAEAAEWEGNKSEKRAAACEANSSWIGCVMRKASSAVVVMLAMSRTFTGCRGPTSLW